VVLRYREYLITVVDTVDPAVVTDGLCDRRWLVPGATADREHRFTGFQVEQLEQPLSAVDGRRCGINCREAFSLFVVVDVLV